MRDRIEAKQRRTVKWPLLVGNPSAAAADIETFRKALAAHQAVLTAKKQAKKRPTKADLAREGQLKADLQSALKRASETVEMIELQSLPEDEWEALFGPIEPDENGELDLTPIHAVALAASCTDPELQDVDWWTEQFKRPEWSAGDRSVLSKMLLELNVYAPRFDVLGKG
ncbi:MAG TPA: hypothetical protein VJ456_06745 [Acidimicrobiia bacterium]|nr:hypothetical protein [Acidimicrobiia bacterium]